MVKTIRNNRLQFYPEIYTFETCSVGSVSTFQKSLKRKVVLKHKKKWLPIEIKCIASLRDSHLMCKVALAR